MDPAIEILMHATLTVAALVALVYIFVRIVRRAKKGGKDFRAIGAALMLFGFGSPQDSVNEITEQAEKLKRSDEDGSGDPPIAKK